MADERAQYYRRLRRMRTSARRFSALAGAFGGAAAVLTPYHGIGLADAVWAALAGGSAMLAAWRWSDARALQAQPPPPPDPALPRQPQHRLAAVVERLPAGRAALGEVRRAQARLRLRGSAVADAWGRLDRAAEILSGLSWRLGGPAEAALQQAAPAERGLRDLAERAASVERALRLAPPDTRADLDRAHQDLMAQLENGVAAYERLVAAAAGYVAEDGRATTEHPATARLAEATDLLRGVAAGLSELRHLREPASDPLSAG